MYDEDEFKKVNELFKKYLKIRSKTKTGDEKSLYIHNDNVHSMNDIIVNLMVVCDLDEVQAEQCALIAHNKGKCEVKVLSEPLL